MDKNVRFLLIDDQPENLISLKAQVKEAFPDAEVFTAGDGQAGLKLARQYEPEVIVLDIRMPGIDGYEVCRLLKAEERLRDIPVIFATAQKRDRETRLKAIESGCEAFIRKPVDEIELLAQLRAMLKIRETNRIKQAEKEKLMGLVDRKSRDLISLEDEYQSVLDELPALVCAFLPDSTLLYVNKAYCNYFNLPEEALLGKKFLDFLPEPEQDKAKRKYLALTGANSSNRYIYPTLHEGKLGWQEWRNRAIFDENGQAKHYYSIGVDITDRKQNEEKLIFLSYHDHLTGLYNRRFFEEEMKRLNTARNLPISIVMADVNGLKMVNDSFGHAAGDDLLKRAAEFFRQGCREEDVLARIGGDEFAIILPQTYLNRRNHADCT
jgi:PAS domain S-box-containing protein